MEKSRNSGIQRGQAITFRLPSDTPDHIIKQMQKLKETERRNFSSKIAEFVLEGVSTSLSKDRETVTIPMPKQLSKEQRNWLKHAHSEAMLGNIVYQLLSDPVRAMSILASLNSNALDIDQALHLQVEPTEKVEDEFTNTNISTEPEALQPEFPTDELEDDLMNFDWDQVKHEHAATAEDLEENVETESLDDLLGDFLSRMNK
ncbi:hypothetical protein KD050_12265 [Psychrobacillus sp. INOP01]|uniref:hypothetical protein n=1 Tax=Psychrobacillus sp. INOP01 TaxID=2829187 RepID=UPI001BA8D3FD|nr:hypothetical protein [Psychrobacillus sp. INOP01]QUG40090.1 hypothetical protein KD050_12265 [Psychrobacillus sp. INOP01]